MRLEQVRGEVGGEAEHRAHRQVDVPGEHDHRLADREQREHGRVEQDELELRQAEEARLDRRRHDHEQQEDGDDPELPDPEDQVDEAVRRG